MTQFQPGSITVLSQPETAVQVKISQGQYTKGRIASVFKPLECSIYGETKIIPG